MSVLSLLKRCITRKSSLMPKSLNTFCQSTLLTLLLLNLIMRAGWAFIWLILSRMPLCLHLGSTMSIHCSFDLWYVVQTHLAVQFLSWQTGHLLFSALFLCYFYTEFKPSFTTFLLVTKISRTNLLEALKESEFLYYLLKFFI